MPSELHITPSGKIVSAKSLGRQRSWDARQQGTWDQQMREFEARQSSSKEPEADLVIHNYIPDYADDELAEGEMPYAAGSSEDRAYRKGLAHGMRRRAHGDGEEIDDPNQFSGEAVRPAARNQEAENEAGEAWNRLQEEGAHDHARPIRTLAQLNARNHQLHPRVRARDKLPVPRSLREVNRFMKCWYR